MKPFFPLHVVYTSVLLACGSLASVGCALTSKSAPLQLRFFTLDVDSKLGAGAGAQAGAGKKLRLGTIDAAAHLRERMVFRESDVELAYRDEQRWSERPEAYLRRALNHAMFEQRGVSQVLSGGGPALDATLLALDEIVGDSPKVRVTVQYSLHDDLEVIRDASVTVEKPIAKGKDDDHPEAVATVNAFREALAEVVTKVADDCVSKLELPPPPPPPEPEATETEVTTCVGLAGAALVKCQSTRKTPVAPRR